VFSPTTGISPGLQGQRRRSRCSLIGPTPPLQLSSPCSHYTHEPHFPPLLNQSFSNESIAEGSSSRPAASPDGPIRLVPQGKRGLSFLRTIYNVLPFPHSNLSPVQLFSRETFFFVIAGEVPSYDIKGALVSLSQSAFWARTMPLFGKPLQHFTLFSRSSVGSPRFCCAVASGFRLFPPDHPTVYASRTYSNRPGPPERPSNLR